MKSIIHIGTEKTATTTLQNFLFKNRATLMESHCYKPVSTGQKNDKALAISAYDASRRDSFTKQLGITTNDELVAFQEDTRSKLIHEISNCDCHTVVFTSEHLQSRLRDEHDLLRLRQLLEDCGVSNFRIVVYLREPSATANSMYSTAVKCGSTDTGPPHPAESQYFRNVCDHKSTIERFSAVFGAENIVPRIFEKQSLVGGSIERDFLDCLGIKDFAKYKPVQAANPGLSVEGIELLRRLNREIPYFTDEGVNPNRGNIAGLITRHFGESSYTMPAEVRRQYEEFFEASNEWVRRRYFPTRPRLFSAAKEQPRTQVGMTDHDFDRIAALISDLWNSRN